MKTIDVKWVVNKQELLDGNNQVLIARNAAQLPAIAYRDAALIRLTLVSYDYQSGTYVAYSSMSGGSTFAAALDYDWDHDVPPMCRADDDAINVPDDWADADPAVGKFAIRLSAKTEEFRDAMGARDSRMVLLEIRSFDGDGEQDQLITGIPLLALNSLDDLSDPPTPVQDNFYSRSASDARYVRGTPMVVDLPAGETSVTVLYSKNPAEVPVAVDLELMPPTDAADWIFIRVPVDSLSAAGWTLQLNVAPTAGYRALCIPIYITEDDET